MATANQNSSAPNKVPLFQRYAGLHKDSPHSVTPQNFKISHIQTAKGEANLLDTAKTSTKSQSGPSGASRQIMTLQNSQIHGRKVDSPKIYVNESDIQDSRPKTSAQCNRKIKNKSKKVSQVLTPANIEKKLKGFKKEKHGAHTNQTTSGSCLTIFPAHPVSSRRPQQRFDFTFNQEKEDLEAAGALPITERDVKRKANSNINDINGKDASNNSAAQLSQQTAGLSKYQQNRVGTRAKSTGGVNSKNHRSRVLSQSMQLGVSSVKPHNINHQLQTPNQLSTHPSAFSQNQSTINNPTGSKTMKSQRQPKYTTSQHQKGIDDTSRGRQTRSSDQKSKPTLAAASKKGMTIRKSKMQKSQMTNFHYNSKSQSRENGASLRYRLNGKKSHSIESQSKQGPSTKCDRHGAFSFDLEDKENYPSNSSLHQNKSKPLLSEQSKSVSAGRSRVVGRNPRLQNDLSLSSLSRSSRNLKIEPSGGSLSKMLGKQFFLDGEHILKLFSPGPAHERSENPRRQELDAKMLSGSRASSPQKPLHQNQVQARSSRHQQKSQDAVKQSLDQKSEHLKQIKMNAGQITSHGELIPTSKHQHQSKKQSAEKQMKQKNPAYGEQFRKYMEDNHNDREAKRVKDSEHSKIHDHSKTKKKKNMRSKSCNSKIGEIIFSQRERDKSKESADKYNGVPDTLSGSYKRKADQTYIGDLNKLKNELNEEIKRERQTVVTPQAAKAANALHQKNRVAEPRKSSNSANFTSIRLNEINRSLIASQLNPDSLSKVQKDKSSDINKLKIQRYIEKQKRQAQKNKTIRYTIEHDKVMRVKETLIKLQELPKRKKIKSGDGSAKNVLRGPLNISKVPQRSEPGLNSTQQISLLDRQNAPAKQLRNTNTKPLRQKKLTKTIPIQSSKPGQTCMESYVHDSIKDNVNQHDLGEEFDDSQLDQQTYHGQDQDHDLSIMKDEEFPIIDIFRKEFSSNSSNKHADIIPSPAHSDIDQPLRQLGQKPTVQNTGPSQQTRPATANKKNNLRVNPPTIQNIDQVTIPKQKNESVSKNNGNLGNSDFESLVPSRYPTDECEKNKHATKSTPKQPSSNIYDESEKTNDRKQSFNELTDIIFIQKYLRGFLARKRVKSQQSKKSSPYTNTDPQNTAERIKRNQNVPPLQLQKIGSSDSHNNPYGQQKSKNLLNVGVESGQQSSSARSHSIFDHHSFPHTAQIRPLPADNISSIPELIKIREELVKTRQEEEQQYLQQQLDHNKVSPRTFKRKQQEIEVWVNTQTKEIKKEIRNHYGEEDRIEQLRLNVDRDNEQIKQLLGSARSSTKSKQINSNTHRERSHRVKESDLIHLIYKSQSQKNGDNSSQSHKQDCVDNQNYLKVQDGRPSSQNSQSQPNSQNYESQSHQTSMSMNQYDEYGIPHDGADIPELDDVKIPTPQVQVQPKQKELTIDPQNNNNLNININQPLTNEKSEHSLNRQLSQQRLKSSDPDILPAPPIQEEEKLIPKVELIGTKKPSNSAELPDQKPDKAEHGRHLNKTDNRTKLHETNEDEDAMRDLEKQVMQVSPKPSSEGSQTNIKDELKESLRKDNFFTRRTDPQPKTDKIRIQIGGPAEEQPQNQAMIGTTISPHSVTSSEIKHGGMSLESSTSGENAQKLSMVIHEIKDEQENGTPTNTNTTGTETPNRPAPHVTVTDISLIEGNLETTLNAEQAAYADALSNNIMQLLVDELRIDFELLINRDQAQLIQNQQAQALEQQQMQQQLSGIKTDLFAIERYVDEIVEEIKLNAADFLRTLNQALTKDQHALLQQLQNTEVGSCEHFDESYPFVLPLELYLTLEKRRKETRERNNEEQRQGNPPPAAGSTTEMYRVLIAECEHIHNKVLFDCINDSLLQFKPYGKEGEPLPWSRKNRRLKPTDDFSVNEIFEIVKHDLFRWAITQAGTLPRREFVYRGVFDEELFSEIREKKLVAMLGREMVETEPRWLNYEFEQAQVKIDLSDNILEILVTECIQQLKLSEEEQDYSDHPLMRQQAEEESNEPQQETQDLEHQAKAGGGQRELELYEEHILKNIGVEGGAVRRPKDNSQDPSGYNSKDSDFSNNYEGSEVADDFGGNHSHDDSNSNYHDDDF